MATIRSDVCYFGLQQAAATGVLSMPEPSNIHPIDAAFALLSTGEIKQLNSIHKGTPCLLQPVAIQGIHIDEASDV